MRAIRWILCALLAVTAVLYTVTGVMENFSGTNEGPVIECGEEIIQVSKKIGTFETSILPYEDCCTIFVAKHPVTKPRAEVIRAHEHNLDEKIDEMVDRAIATDDIINISSYRPE